MNKHLSHHWIFSWYVSLFIVNIGIIIISCIYVSYLHCLHFIYLFLTRIILVIRILIFFFGVWIHTVSAPSTAGTEAEWKEPRLECLVSDPSVQSGPRCPQRPGPIRRPVFGVRGFRDFVRRTISSPMDNPFGHLGQIPDVSRTISFWNGRDKTPPKRMKIEGSLTFHKFMFVLDSQAFRTWYFFLILSTGFSTFSTCWVSPVEQYFKMVYVNGL